MADVESPPHSSIHFRKKGIFSRRMAASSMNYNNPQLLTDDDIRTFLMLLSEKLTKQGIAAEIFIVGGAALALAYNRERTTADVDALVEPRDVVLAAAKEIASECNLSEGWLSDAVRQMMPLFPDEDPREIAGFGSLRVSVGSPEYVLAMKAMVSRKSLGDLDDAAQLCNALGLRTEEHVAAVVSRYYGGSPLGAQELWLEDIVERAAQLRREAR